MRGDVKKVRAGNISAVSLSVAPQKLIPLSRLEPVRAFVDFACVSRGGDVALIGWLYDPQDQVQGFHVVRDPQYDAPAQEAPGVESSADTVVRIELRQVARPDVAQVMDKSASEAYCFAILL